jgi:hypothetical protein
MVGNSTTISTSSSLSSRNTILNADITGGSSSTAIFNNQPILQPASSNNQPILQPASSNNQSILQPASSNHLAVRLPSSPGLFGDSTLLQEDLVDLAGEDNDWPMLDNIADDYMEDEMMAGVDDNEPGSEFELPPKGQCL